MKVIPLLSILLLFCSSYGQIVNRNRVSKKITISKDTIVLENVAISPVNIIVKNKKGVLIPKEKYYINPNKAQFYFPTKKPQQISISYFKYPDFITQSYHLFDKKIIIPLATKDAPTYSLKKKYGKEDFFGGLETYGNITRGITVGNNQGSVVNSGLDLQITGDLSENLKIRASIKDSNIPIQENGVSQNINEFDRVFIELYTDKWNLKAGDVDLTNQDSYFLNFTKKINGAKLDVVLDNGDQKTSITASAALARGRFNSLNIRTQEGNQGPYRLSGVNGEPNVVIISGSETVFVNGIALKRGEQYDYTIDYNTAEITFTPTFPINSTQRIVVDYQYSDQNYNRFVTHEGFVYENEKFKIASYFYNENDVKSQPIQQNLSDEQKLVLKQAGNDTDKMVAESAQVASFDENRIQYRKHEEGYFITSTNPDDTLYNVIFSPVGANNGDYILTETVATGNRFEYIAPENGIKQGNFAPIVQLFAPTKTQMAVVKTGYQINKGSFIDAELAYSDNDQNLFSSVDNSKNKGIATTLTWQQQLSSKKWQSFNLLEADFVHQNFNNIEGLYNPEFNRDWNIDPNLNPNFLGNQLYLRDGLVFEKKEAQKIAIKSAYLSLGDAFTGINNSLDTYNTFDQFIIQSQSSHLESKSLNDEGTFTRHQSNAKYHLKKMWLAGLLTYENNLKENTQTKIRDSITSQKIVSTGGFVGLGDSTKVYAKMGYTVSRIDSVKTNILQRVQNTQNYTLEGQWIKTKKSSLNTYTNYRKVENLFTEDLNVLNSRLQYSQQLFNNIARITTVYETSSGSTPQQNFTYIETEPGQGYYTYLGDLNGNNVKDFDEFEVAQFSDQANYLRVALPNTNRIATQKAKLSQSLFLNFGQFRNHKNKWLKALSHFSNQSSILIDKDQLKKGKEFNMNPFDNENSNVVGLQKNILTNLYFNRGLQKYSTTYTYQNSQNTQNILSGLAANNQKEIQTATNQGHEINFQHNIKDNWLINLTSHYKTNTSTSTNFNSRNFEIVSKKIAPSLSFLKDEFSTLETVYSYRDEENTIGSENLNSHNLGINYNYTNPEKGSVLASFNYIENTYEGTLNTPASYRILEGLQPGKNYTWSLIVQRKLTQLLDLSINYNGRKNTINNTIHVGSVQLRANF